MILDSVHLARTLFKCASTDNSDRQLAFELFSLLGIVSQGDNIFSIKDATPLAEYFGVESQWAVFGRIAYGLKEGAQVLNIDFYVFRATQREMEQFYKQIQDKVKHLQNVKCLSFDDGFVEGIGGSLDRTNDLEAFISDEMVTLTINNSFGKHEAYSAMHRIEQ